MKLENISLRSVGDVKGSNLSAAIACVPKPYINCFISY